MKKIQDPKNNPEITFMLGNHEMQFIETVEIMKRKGLNKDDLLTIMARSQVKSQLAFYSLHNDQRSIAMQINLKEKLKPFEQEYQKLLTEKELTEDELNVIRIWLNSNQGDTTIFDFLKDGRIKTAEEQRAIYSFLLNSYVALPKNINGKDYLFVHSMPPYDPEMIRQMKQLKKGYMPKDLTRNQYYFMLEEREHKTYKQAKAYGFTTICGHTPELGNIIVDEEEGFVRIDAGCGHKKSTSKLALYCIDDKSVEFFDEKEFPQEEQSL